VPTARAFIDAVLAATDVPLIPDTVDTIKTGDPETELTGVVSTFLASHAVIQRTIELGANLIVTHEPTFYGHLDETDWLADDPVYRAKRALLDDNGIVVWRFHDHWHARQPDGVLTAVIEQLSWSGDVIPSAPNFVRIPTVTLADLCEHVRVRLGVEALRVIGDPARPCSTVGVLIGAPGGQEQMRMLPAADVLIAGEVAEWETTEYVRDALAQGTPKALIVAGHEPTEEAGMAAFVEWASPMFPGLSITHVPSGNPFA
jgi:putative NIF3 family GTP cyclohydrolase 1 type 2